MSWAKKIKEYRRDHGYTQRDLAEKFGVDVGTISRWERGLSVPHAELRKRFASVYIDATDQAVINFLRAPGVFGSLNSEDKCLFVGQASQMLAPNANIVGSHPFRYTPYQYEDTIGKVGSRLLRGDVSNIIYEGPIDRPYNSDGPPFLRVTCTPIVHSRRFMFFAVPIDPTPARTTVLDWDGIVSEI